MTITSNSTASMMTNIVNYTSTDIVSQMDTDSNNALSMEELGIDEDFFNSLDSNSDSLVTQSEIAEAIDSKLSEYDEMPTPDQFSSLLSDLGLEMSEPPEASQESSDFAAQLMSNYDTNGDSSLSAEELSLLSTEEFNALDGDDDGSVNNEELTSAIDEVAASSTSAPVATTSSSSLNSSSEDSSDTIKMLFEAIKANAEDSTESIDLSKFESIMKLANAQNSDSEELNTFISNLSDKNSSTVSYA